MKRLIILILSVSSTICWSQEKNIQTGQSIPTEKIENQNCLDNSSTAIRLLSHEPHVPFAIIEGNTSKSAGQPCCEEWATTQMEWFNISEYGKIVGKSKVIAGDGYDVTQCYELQLETTSGEDGTGLYVSKEMDWGLNNKQIWSPSQVESEKLNDFILDLNKLVIDDNKQDDIDTLTKGKMMFFKIVPNQNKNNDINIPITKCVVFGKKYLMIAYLNSQEEWTLAHIENEYTNNDYQLYTPIALIDIDKDGIPEIIFQNSSGTAFWDEILRIRYKDTIDSWQVEATSVEGAKI